MELKPFELKSIKAVSIQKQIDPQLKSSNLKTPSVQKQKKSIRRLAYAKNKDITAKNTKEDGIMQTFIIKDTKTTKNIEGVKK